MHVNTTLSVINKDGKDVSQPVIVSGGHIATTEWGDTTTPDTSLVRLAVPGLQTENLSENKLQISFDPNFTDDEFEQFIQNDYVVVDGSYLLMAQYPEVGRNAMLYGLCDYSVEPKQLIDLGDDKQVVKISNTFRESKYPDEIDITAQSISYPLIKKTMFPSSLHDDRIAIINASSPQISINELGKESRRLEDEIKRDKSNKSVSIDALTNKKNQKVEVDRIINLFKFACDAVRIKNFGLLEFILGPTVYGCEQEYIQEHRNKRYFWLKMALKKGFYIKAKSTLEEHYILQQMLQFQGDRILKAVQKDITREQNEIDKRRKGLITEQFDLDAASKGTNKFHLEAKLTDHLLKEPLEEQIKIIKEYEYKQDELTPAERRSLAVRTPLLHRVEKLHESIKRRRLSGEKIKDETLDEYRKLMQKYSSVELHKAVFPVNSRDSVIQLDETEVKEINSSMKLALDREMEQMISYLRMLLDKEVDSLHKERAELMAYEEVSKRYKKCFIEHYEAYLITVFNEFKIDALDNFTISRNIHGYYRSLVNSCNYFDKQSNDVNKKQSELANKYRKNYKKVVDDFRKRTTGWLRFGHKTYKLAVSPYEFNTIIDKAANRGQDARLLINMRNHEGNPLLHLVTREYGVALYESKQSTSMVFKLNLANFNRMFYILCEHGAFPSTLNNRIITNSREIATTAGSDEKAAMTAGNMSVVQETAYEHANNYLIEHINNRRRLTQNDKNRKEDKNNHLLPDYFMLQTVLKCIPTYSAFTSEFKAKLLQVCEKAQDKINGFFSQIFDSETIKALTHCIYFSILVFSCHEASQELSDMIVLEKFKSLKNDKSDIKFIKNLLEMLNTVVKEKQLIMLTTPKDVIDGINTDKLRSVLNERNKLINDAKLAEEKYQAMANMLSLSSNRVSEEKIQGDFKITGVENIAVAATSSTVILESTTPESKEFANTQINASEDAKSVADQKRVIEASATDRCRQVEEENRILKETLANNGITLPEHKRDNPPANTSTHLNSRSTLFVAISRGNVSLTTQKRLYSLRQPRKVKSEYTSHRAGIGKR